MAITRFSPRWIEGRRIVRFDARPWRDDDFKLHYDPLIVLDNGAELVFIASEVSDGSTYGVTPIYRRAKS